MPESTCNVHKLIADVALLSDDRIALVRFARSSSYDGQTGWFLPDDELAFLEHPEDVATRILREQLGIPDLQPRLDHIESFRGNDRSWHLVFHFVADITDPSIVKVGEGIGALEWFTLGRLPERADVAHHGWALDVIDKIVANRGTEATLLNG